MPAPGSDQRIVLAAIRHELRTPLNAILGYSAMLLEDADDPDLAPLVPDLQRIESAGRDLLALVDQIIDPAATEESEILDLDLVQANLRRDLRTPITTIIGYAELLLEDAADRDGDRVASDLAKIHTAAERFLAFIDDVVRFSSRSGGDDLVEADSPDASLLARRVTASVQALDHHSALPSTRHEQGSILVVDDNQINRDVLARYLDRQGHAVATAAGGHDALALVRSEQFDLILLDIMMPEINGLQVLQQLKSDPRLCDIPVIMISALDEVDSVVRSIELGAEDYLPKPFNPTLLRARIDAGLEKKRLRDQEVDYLRQVARVTAAAAEVEVAAFDPASLDGVADRADALGQLARVFQRMAREVHEREERLQRQVRELRIEIDETREARKVAEITESESYQRLRSQAEDLRKIIGSASTERSP